jgi:hypothetical protein
MQTQLWYAQLPGILLAVLSYLLMVRFAWELVAGGRGDNIVVRVLRSVTNLAVRPVAAITPRLLPAALVTGCAVIWVYAARIMLVQVMAALAMRRTLG